MFSGWKHLKMMEVKPELGDHSWSYYTGVPV